MSLTKKVAALCGGLLGALAATPVLAQDLGSTTSDAAGAAISIVFLVCWGLIFIIFLALFIFWVLMLVDVIKRDEADFPGSTGSSKTMWLIILLVSWLIGFYWLAAVIYYFVVKRKAAGMPKAPASPPPPPMQPPSETPPMQPPSETPPQP